MAFPVEPFGETYFMGGWQAALASQPQRVEELRDLAINARAARMVWLESYGVPISNEFAQFAEAIGLLIEACDPPKEPK